MEKTVCGLTYSQWQEKFPVIKDIMALKETSWINTYKIPFYEAVSGCRIPMSDILDAGARLDRFAPYLSKAFPETAASGGIIESGVLEIKNMKPAIEEIFSVNIPGRLFLKMDSHLAVSGSIKARGGIYEVLKTAEDIALKNGFLDGICDCSVYNSERFRSLFSGYSIAVGSTGNLGLSIGLIGAKLGFNVTVHMSSDARQWKKDMLRAGGVNVIEYSSDYSEAVKQGRIAAAADPWCHFVDDENSEDLFLGYSVAALRLKDQLRKAGITVDGGHPLFVYLPCGVGGGPGGVAYGLKMVYGDAVHCFFAEPVSSCSMLLGLMTGENNNVCVQDFGLDNITIADGLAVGRASGLAAGLIRPFLSGCYTISDERLLRLLRLLKDTEGISLEPSALAGFYGPAILLSPDGFRQYIVSEDLFGAVDADACTHLVWATGGSLVPEDEFERYYAAGRKAPVAPV